jgi:hypothetical protein
MFSYLFALLALLPSTRCEASTSRVKIGTVPAEVSPYSGTQPTRITMQGYQFQISKSSSRARVVVEFSFEHLIGEPENPHGPAPSYLQPEGLIYDAASRSVIFAQGSLRTVCATVEEGRNSTKVRNTGNCSVSSAVTSKAEENGWNISKTRVIEIFLETR